MDSAIDMRFIDLALLLIVLEGVALITWRRLKGEGPRPAALIANLAAGAFLLIVARELWIGAGGLWVAAPLTAALVAHGFDVVARWERRPKPNAESLSEASAPRPTSFGLQRQPGAAKVGVDADPP
jgi:hypothetical protein